MSRPQTLTVYERLPNGETRISVRMAVPNKDLPIFLDLLREDIIQSMTNAFEKEWERVTGEVPTGIVSLDEIRRTRKP